MTTAFVLGGGGVLGAHEVGMLRALAEAGIRPDLVVGTSVGAINGAFVAADPAAAAVRLRQLWEGAHLQRAFSGTLLGRAARLARSGTHLHAIEPLRQMLDGRAAGQGLRRPGPAVQLRRGEHRAGQCPLVHRRAAGARRAGLVRGAGPAAAGGDRRRALLRRRPGRFDPGRPRRRAGRPHGLRAARRADRAAAGPAGTAVGGRAGRLRDRPPAPFPRGDVARCRAT